MLSVTTNRAEECEVKLQRKGPTGAVKETKGDSSNKSYLSKRK